MITISKRIFAVVALFTVAACGAATSAPPTSQPVQSTTSTSSTTSVASKPQFTDIHDEDCKTKPTRCDVDACNKWRVSQGLPTADYQCNQLCDCAE